MRLFTIGHSTRSMPDFIGLLADAGITRLVDVRRFPHSRRHPQFDGESLAKALQPHAVAYHHLPDLGGRRKRSEGPHGPNGFWRHPSFRNYAGYAMTAPFQEALRDLLELGSRDTCAIMCAEAVWWRCHRRIIADYLIHHGSEVIHILGTGRTAVAEPTAAATAMGDVLVYPSGDPDLDERAG